MRLRYTADSIKRELETQGMFTVNGGVECPQAANWTPNGNVPCPGTPSSCPHVQSQTCKQAIDVYYSNNTGGCRLGVLTFTFTVSPTDYNGYIDANDSQLARLIMAAKNGNGPPINPQNFVKC